jgi:hypothetical protein
MKHLKPEIQSILVRHSLLSARFQFSSNLDFY